MSAYQESNAADTRESREGENQGVLEHGEMLVSRNGKLVAKVHIWNVQRERCVANVLPGWKLSDIVEGDEAVPAL